MWNLFNESLFVLCTNPCPLVHLYNTFSSPPCIHKCSYHTRARYVHVFPKFSVGTNAVHSIHIIICFENTKVYPKLPELAPKTENGKKYAYSFLPLDVSIATFRVRRVSFAAITLCVATKWMFILVRFKCNPRFSNGWFEGTHLCFA
jgi:hypothetical protein